MNDLSELGTDLQIRYMIAKCMFEYKLEILVNNLGIWIK